MEIKMKPKITPRRGNTNNTYIIKAEVEAEVIMVEYTKETQEEFAHTLRIDHEINRRYYANEQ